MLADSRGKPQAGAYLPSASVPAVRMSHFGAESEVMWFRSFPQLTVDLVI